jgi:putative FmdB family regulatory protein
MPRYEFHCLSCNNITEKHLAISDTTQNIMCEWCDEHTAKRIISRSTFHLKGGGWYQPAASESTSSDGLEDSDK